MKETVADLYLRTVDHYLNGTTLSVTEKRTELYSELCSAIPVESALYKDEKLKQEVLSLCKERLSVISVL